MLLPDHEIASLIDNKIIGIDPYDASLVNPCSLDVRLDRHFRVPAQHIHNLDVANVPVDHTYACQGETFVIKPGEFVLGSTWERVILPDDIAARVEGKSSVGRMGLSVHVTAGWIDPGFDGTITLELKNEAPWSITMRFGMRIAQLAFFSMDNPCEKPYGMTGRYLDQITPGPVESRYTFTPPVVA